MPKTNNAVIQTPPLTRKARHFQQQQSENQRRQNDILRTTGQLSNGTNFTLTSDQTPFGSRDLCVGILALNCIQANITLQTATRELIFQVARTIETDPYYERDRDGNKKEDNRELRSSFAQQCMDHQALHDIAKEMAEELLTATGRSMPCIEITPRYIKKIALLFRSDGIPQDACDHYAAEMNNKFLTCADEAASNAALLYLLFLIAIPVFIAAEEGIRRNWDGFKRNVGGCMRAVSECPSALWHAIKSPCGSDNGEVNTRNTPNQPFDDSQEMAPPVVSTTV